MNKSLSSLLWVSCALICAVSAQGAGKQLVSGHIPSAAASIAPQGRLAATQQLNLAIGLPLRKGDILDELVKELSDPASPNYRHYLTPAQFTEQFGPTEADYNAVIAFATAHGLTVTATYPNRMLLDVSGPVSAVEQAMHVKMQVYPHPTESRSFYAPDTNPSLDLNTPILDVSGLQNYSRPQPRFVSKPLAKVQAASPAVGSGPGGAYMGKDFRAAYVPDTTMTGTGQTVGLLQFDGYTASDITAYEAEAGLASVPLANVLLDGFSGAPTGDGGEIEVSLDIEMNVSMAPGLSKIIVYEAGPSGDWHDILNRMANDNLAKQMSCSWYSPGEGPDPVAEQIFQQMAAQGQTFFVACGDSDAYTGPMPFPDDSPNVMEVGGTTLTTSGPGGSWVAEQVWNWGDGIGTGGGVSTYYSIPSYQTNINMSVNQGSTTMRNIPDIAMTADNVDVRADGYDQPVGGTSCAAPLWAGFTALCNQMAASNGRPVVGFINPALDAIGTGSYYGTAFHDITVGNNTSGSSPSKFFAEPGFDLCTGWGVPAGQTLIRQLAVPDPLGIEPNGGFAAEGVSGGPFTVTSEVLTLTNSGTSNITWTASANQPWLSVSPSSGGLASQGPSAPVTVSLTAAAYTLPITNYASTVTFTNLTTGVTQTRQFTLEVVPSVPPAIAAQPSNETVFVDFNASFTVGVSGAPPFDYQWRFDGTNLNGATNAILTLTNVSFSEAGSYSVIISNTIGSTNSANAILTVNPPPPCALVPAGLISWWQGEGNANDAAGINNGTLVGGTTFGLGEVGQAFSFNGNDQYVQVPDSPSLRPASVSLECWFMASNSGASGNLVSKPVGTGYFDSFDIWFQNNNLNAAVGNPAGLGAQLNYPYSPTPGSWHHVAYTYDSATENQALYLDGEAVLSGNAGVQIAYDSNPVLMGTEFDYEAPVLPFTGEIDEVSIYNRALNAGEVASIYNALFTGKCPLAPTPPVIISQPANETVYQGSTAAFNVGISGSSPLSYQWQFDTTNISGATNSVLTLTNVAFGQAGSYSVVVSNALGTTNSADAVLTVNPAPPCDPVPSGLISWWKGEGNAYDQAGINNGTLINGVTFAPGEVGQAFSFNGSNQYVQIADSPSLRPASVSLECWFAVNKAGGADFLMGKPVGSQSEDSYSMYLTNGNLQASVGTATAFGTALSYPLNPVPGVWYHVAFTFDGASEAQTLYVNGVAVTSGTSGLQIGYDSHSANIGCDFDYGIPIFAFNGEIDEASIYNRALNAGEVASIYNALFTGKCPLAPTPPVITSQPANQAVYQGFTAVFNVGVTGSSPLSYQWQFDATNIDGATNSVLTLTNIAFDQAGSYSVIVANAVGSTNSGDALLTVNPAPPCDPVPAGLVSWWQGEGNTLDATGLNNGIAEGALSYAPGEVGQAFSIDNLSKYVMIPASGTLNVGTNVGITIECWVNPSDIIVTRPMVEWNSGNGNGVHFWFSTVAPGVTAPGTLFANFVDTGNVYHYFSSPAGTVKSNVFQHVAATYDKSSGNAALYCNGAVVATTNLG